MVTTTARRPGAGRLEGEHRGGRRLADAARAAADDDAALVRPARASAGRSPVVTRRSGRERVDLGEQPVGQHVELGRTELGGEQERQAELGERELLGQPADLLGLQRHAVAAERGGRGQRLGLARRASVAPAASAAAAGSASRPGSVG